MAVLIPEYRLGWHQDHDPRNRAFGIADWLDLSKPITKATWPTLTAALNQGQLGSCTGNATIAMCATPKLRKAAQRYDEGAAVAVYQAATRLDGITGDYPPYDTGSTTVAALKAARSLGLIGTYRWSFDFNHTLRALSQIGPIITGFYWWSSDYNPAPNGAIRASGQVVGGHELCWDQIWPNSNWRGGGYCEGWQSWGLWGPIGGRIRISWTELQWRLANGGEVGIAFP